MKAFLLVLRVAWDDRLSRLAVLFLIYLAAVNNEPLSGLLLAFSLILGTAVIIAQASAGENGLDIPQAWIQASWFAAVFMAMLFCMTLMIG